MPAASSAPCDEADRRVEALRPHPRSRRRMAGPARPKRVAIASVILVALLLFGAAPFASVSAGHGSPAAGLSFSAGARPVPPSLARAAAASVPLSGAGVSSISAAVAGSVFRTVFPNYNATLPGNFPGTVDGWQVGSPAYVPSTQELWLPNRAVSVNGIAPPPYAPAIIYNATTNQFVGFDFSVQNTSAFAYDPNNGVLYSADYGNNTVGVIDATTGSWLQPAIPVGSGPDALALNVSGGLLYVANYNSGTVSVIDCSTESIGNAGISTGTEPVALALDQADHTLFVADGGDSYLGTIDTATNSTGVSVHLSGPLGGVAYSEKADDIAITVPSSSTLAIYNATALTQDHLTTIGTGDGPVVTGSSGTFFFVGNATGSSVSVVNTSSYTVYSTVTVGSHVAELYASPAPALVFAWGASSRNLSLINQISDTVESWSSTLGPNPWSLGFDASTNRVYVADSLSGSVAILNASTGATAAAPIRVPSGALSVSVDSVAGLLYVGAWNGVYEYNASSDAPIRNLTATLAGGNSPILVDRTDGVLWAANPQTGVHALTLGALTPRFTISIKTVFAAQHAMDVDARLGELFVVNATAGVVEGVNATTGTIISPAIAAGPSPASLAFDRADNVLYVAGSNVTMIDPATGAAIGATIPLPIHTATPTIAYDPTREYLYVATYNGSPTRETVVTALDGSSVAASEGSQVTMLAGELVADIAPVVMSGSRAPADSAIWLANAQSGTLTIIASPPVATGFVASPDAIDVGASSQFLLSYSGGTGPDTVSYSGLPGGCLSADTAALNCTPTASGNFTVTATITDAFGLTASLSTLLVVHAGLTVQVALTPGMLLDAGSNLGVAATVSGGAAPYSYVWSFGNGNAATQSNATTSYPTPGSYLVSVTVTDSTRAVATDSFVVTVAAPPSGSVLVRPRNATDVGVFLNFTAMTSGGTGTQAEGWSFGDGTSATGASATHAWSQPGNYSVIFDYRDTSGRSWTQTEVVHVAPSLNATFTVGTPGGGASVGSSVSFAALPVGGLPPYNVTWIYGDGSVGFGLTPTHAYAIAGKYTVDVVVTDTAGEHVSTALQLLVATSTGASVPPSSSSQSPGVQLFLGLLIGGAVAAAVLALSGRSKKRNRHPPSPYVPPEGVEPPR